MTEVEWLASHRADAAAVRIGNRLSNRKHFLIGCGYARTQWNFLPPIVRDVITSTEQLADGLTSEVNSPLSETPPEVSYLCRLLATGTLGFGKSSPLLCLNSLYGVSLSIELLRCITGNPFRPIILNSSWLTSTVIALAQKMYDSRDFSAMPILADALQDAGCENTDILDHCREAGPHARGCWIVDKLLAKA
jgi:hypothetical protein